MCTSSQWRTYMSSPLLSHIRTTHFSRRREIDGGLNRDVDSRMFSDRTSSEVSSCHYSMGLASLPALIIANNHTTRLYRLQSVQYEYVYNLQQYLLCCSVNWVYNGAYIIDNRSTPNPYIWNCLPYLVNQDKSVNCT